MRQHPFSNLWTYGEEVGVKGVYILAIIPTPTKSVRTQTTNIFLRTEITTAQQGARVLAHTDTLRKLSPG